MLSCILGSCLALGRIVVLLLVVTCCCCRTSFSSSCGCSALVFHNDCKSMFRSHGYAATSNLGTAAAPKVIQVQMVAIMNTCHVIALQFFQSFSRVRTDPRVGSRITKTSRVESTRIRRCSKIHGGSPGFFRACHGLKSVERLVDGPGRPIICSCSGPRSDPAHHFFFWWAAARPSPSNFQTKGRRPARPIAFHIYPARPDRQFFKLAARPDRQFFKLAGPTRPGPAHGIRSQFHETLALYRLAGHLCGPARGFEGPVHEPAYPLRADVFCVYFKEKYSAIIIVNRFGAFFI